MSTTLEEYLCILDDKPVVDLELLRSASNHGIPEAVRGRVWPYLLGSFPADKGEFVVQ